MEELGEKRRETEEEEKGDIGWRETGREEERKEWGERWRKGGCEGGREEEEEKIVLT